MSVRFYQNSKDLETIRQMIIDVVDFLIFLNVETPCNVSYDAQVGPIRRAHIGAKAIAICQYGGPDAIENVDAPNIREINHVRRRS
jgi:hypothetical protein